MSLRLWLPGYHTPSLNRTAGKHWTKVRRLKIEAAEALYQALRGKIQVPGSKFQVDEARRVLSKLLLGVALERRTGKKPAKPAVPPVLRIERVTCAELDEDNFKGGTKGLVDCLVSAFPAVLLDDAPGYVVREYVQTRCSRRVEEGTWVDLRAGAIEGSASERS